MSIDKKIIGYHKTTKLKKRVGILNIGCVKLDFSSKWAINLQNTESEKIKTKPLN